MSGASHLLLETTNKAITDSIGAVEDTPARWRRAAREALEAASGAVMIPNY